MLLAKCCHDLDWLGYLIGQPCTAVSSFGSLRHFRPEQRPDGRRRPLRRLRDRAGLRVLGAPALPRHGASAARPAGRSTSWPGRRRPRTSSARCARARTGAACGRATTTSSTTRSSTSSTTAASTASFTMTAFTRMRDARDAHLRHPRRALRRRQRDRGLRLPHARDRREHEVGDGVRRPRRRRRRGDGRLRRGGRGGRSRARPDLAPPRRSSRTGSRSPPRRRGTNGGSWRFRNPAPRPNTNPGWM